MASKEPFDEGAVEEPEFPFEPITLDENFDSARVKWHCLTKEQVLETVVVSDLARGVQTANVKKRREVLGSNALPMSGGVSIVKIILSNFFNSITAILAFVAIVSAVFEDWAAFGICVFVILFVAVIGIYQEHNAAASLEALKEMTKGTATVVRDGKAEVIPIDDVVIGDVVILEQGTCLPCDVRLIESTGLEIDECLLTGESVPVQKFIDVIPDPDDKVGMAERINLGYRKTTVTEGRGKGICYAVGVQTEMGKMAAALTGDGDSTTPLQRKMSYLMYAIFGVCIILVLVVFGVNRFNMTDSVIIYGAAVAIAILPQSLVAVIAVAMAISVRKMAAQKCIVRKLGSLEILDSCTDICSDKTGTLTQNKMVVNKVLIGTNNLLTVVGAPLSTVAMFTRADELEDDGTHDTLSEQAINIREMISGDRRAQEFFKASALCGTTQLIRNGTALEGSGNPTEIAIQAMCWKAGSSRKKWKEQGNEPRGEYPFDSRIKRMSAGYYNSVIDQSFVCVKGATERILKECKWKIDGDDVVPTTAEDVAEVTAVLEDFAGRGLRTLCLARRDLRAMEDESTEPAASAEAKADAEGEEKKDDDEQATKKAEEGAEETDEEKEKRKTRTRINSGAIDLSTNKLDAYEREFIESNLTFLGVVGIYDPPRVESKLSVTMCKRAGITVRMLTGDHFATATAIAKEINIVDDAEAKIPYRVMSGPDFDKLTESEAALIEELPKVVGRCSPQTKVRMIDELHRRGRIVAMTGDGFNDAPSIKAADLGCAMGSGTDVTKGVADFVITDDNFATIVKALAEGRRIALSISKFVTHLLCGNMAETVVLVCGLGIMLDEQSVFVLSPMEILWLNLFTSSPPAIGLSMDPAPDFVLRVPPNTKGLFNKELLFDTLVYGISLGASSLLSFVFVLYGWNDGPVGKDCNSTEGEGCEHIWKARTTGYVILYFGMLIHAYNVRFARVSLFRMRWFDNPWIWGSFIFGVVTLIPMIYIPVIARHVFIHEMITWEWIVILIAIIFFVVVSEVYKAIKNTIDPFNLEKVTPEEAAMEKQLFEGNLGVATDDSLSTGELVQHELSLSMSRQGTMASPY